MDTRRLSNRNVEHADTTQCTDRYAAASIRRPINRCVDSCGNASSLSPPYMRRSSNSSTSSSMFSTRTTDLEFSTQKSDDAPAKMARKYPLCAARTTLCAAIDVSEDVTIVVSVRAESSNSAKRPEFVQPEPPEAPPRRAVGSSSGNAAVRVSRRSCEELDDDARPPGDFITRIRSLSPMLFVRYGSRQVAPMRCSILPDVRTHGMWFS